MPTGNTVRVFHLPFSFMLPQRVAHEEGCFEDEGLDVELIERDRASVAEKYIPGEETLTGDNDVDLYPVCKWESLKRTWGMGDGKIVAKGTFADHPYSIFVSPDADIEEPADLDGVPVGVNRRTGQEYTVMKALEEHLAPSAVTLVHCGMPTDRLRALRDRDVEAISLLEPQSTLADHLGFERLLEFENHVGIVAAEDVNEDTLHAFVNAYSTAVDVINENPNDYREVYLDMLDKDRRVAPDLFEDVDVTAIREDVSVPRYEPPELADREALEAHLEWMKDRDLIDRRADVDAIVSPLR